ncbi:kinase-like domain-containing protein [Rhizophagus irregularis DAOM 181602=DAOM 197198]|nr:kinase-like domain-containing protein [Rhizophagus irregularis DAOM 181602=DAOM 197198]POG81045.1 kinase-like domain-containing protein [Rhizophagus irregularis DAOM 181602=DAOM 197198]|eukprot:XP_025187911.1 kinase-like domain-containing protein [Rhizophagus irregularis DAOM 181602=DAOM 197198]
MSQEFIDQLYRYHKCLQSEALADCFGITKDPTSCYMFVMRYYKNGNLYSYLEEFVGNLYWRDIIDMLWSISVGLNFIHEHDLVHGHLHGGNILVENEMDSIDTKIADIGLHGHVDKSMSSIMPSQQIYGIIPFVAPEIFDGNVITKASDIYSFGMIMWMLSTGVRPYCDRPHDKQLIQEICSGLRPSNIDGTPPVYASLMLQCLDANPLKRPTVSQICEYLGNWTSNLSNQFEEEYVNLEKLNLWSLPCHEKAIYFSRLLDF